jgi:hypothetical protein
MPYTNTANEVDFLGEGTVTGAFAPQQTPAQIAEAQKQEAIARQAQIQRDAQALSVANQPYLAERAKGQGGSMYIGEDAEARKASDLAAGITGREYRTPAQQKAWEETHQRGIAGNLIRDPVTLGILAAPYGVVGGGLAAGGAAGLGLGEAAAVGGGTLAPVTAAPSLGAVGTVASPFAAPAAGAAPVMYAAGGAGAVGGAAATGAGGLSLANGLGLAGLGLDVAGVVASQIRTKAEKALIKKQEELAEAAKARQIQVQQEGMNRLGQQMLAMVPQNRMMAEMFGPEAAFTGQQMGQMAADPGANQAAAGQAFDNNNPAGNQFSMEDIARANADRQRQQQVAGAFGPPPQGPAPLQPRTPQPARRF